MFQRTPERKKNSTDEWEKNFVNRLSDGISISRTYFTTLTIQAIKKSNTIAQMDKQACTYIYKEDTHKAGM